MTPRDLKIVNMTWRAASQHDLDRLLTYVVPSPVLYEDGGKTTDHGICDIGTGTIHIRTHSRHRVPRPLSVETLIDTISHELAHLLEYRHGRAHRRLSLALRGWLAANWGHDPLDQPDALKVLAAKPSKEEK